jgi:DNA-directed RNA polymerase subunit K
MDAEKYTKYEQARILGARALQIAMNAPLLIKIEDSDLDKLNYDALKIAEVEFNSDVLPISIKKPMPKRKDSALKRVKTPKIDEKAKAKSEEELEKEIAEEGEIMELANPEDEREDDENSSEED